MTWKAAKPINYFATVPDFEHVLELRMGRTLPEAFRERLVSFGELVATEIEPAVVVLERHREFPQLRPYDEFGQRIDEIEFHPANDIAAAAAWSSGMLATALDAEGAFQLAAQFLLLSYVGEGGQACPIVCTIGLRRALEHHASEELKNRYLALLANDDASEALRGAQFLTEVQGGSDVGANVVAASPDPTIPGAWRISGEKWFCSVADADLFAVTARPVASPPGTRGLGCFVVPRLLDGAPNGFRLRRLKDKLGTRALASGEIDFDNALAWPIGELENGFKIAVSELLNTSRWLNAVGSTGIMCRSYFEASSFARHRHAFGVTINTFAAVRAQLALMKSEAVAALSSTFALTAFVARIDEGTASEADVAIHRFLVNANKYVTSVAASDVVHRAIEVLGGNGTIEDFSALPRLYRDAVVFESWEGTHNVLCAQVRRDCVRLGLLEPVEAWVHELLAPINVAPDARHVIEEALEALRPGLERSLTDDAYAETSFRDHLTSLMTIIQASCLLGEAQHSSSSEKTALARLFIERHLSTPRPFEEPGWHAYVGDALGCDV